MAALAIVLGFWVLFFAGMIRWLVRHPEDFEISVIDLSDSKVP